ncbi:hypothetical protein CDN99_25630 [Roseateles aquatilis]|uniref:Single-stranded DNA-binding protein n=1 Tax=Roseateles aquatilis TaxID=431061 RepID=A0A246IVQ6_9BURK|nr:hypothetical protein [Roseateles aquatilis]OWQ83849.1 hypothetical protein CDN99_25630 [Roseateles aquatilis]
MQSIIQILKLNEPKTGTSAKTGRAYDMQDAECLLLTADGAIDQVGVLQVPKALRDQVKPGTYTATFALNANFASRRIEAVLTGLVAIPQQARQAPASNKAT